MNIIHHVGIITNFNRRIVISIHHMDDNIDLIVHVIMSNIIRDIILYDIISSYMDVRSSRFMFTVNTWWIWMAFPAIISAFNQALSVLSLSLIMFAMIAWKSLNP